jgi:hypothetical protein
LHQRAFAGLPRFDHHLVRRLEHQPVAGVQHVVVEVALPGQPDAAADDRKLAGQAIDAHRFARMHDEGSGLACVQLRLHHQSPVCQRTAFAAP